MANVVGQGGDDLLAAIDREAVPQQERRVRALRGPSDGGRVIQIALDHLDLLRQSGGQRSAPRRGPRRRGPAGQRRHADRYGRSPQSPGRA